MALDQDGNPIPVYVPPPPASPSPPAPLAIENDVALLGSHVETLLIRVGVLEEVTAPVPSLQTRMIAAEDTGVRLAQLTTRFAVVEEEASEVPKHSLRITTLEQSVSRLEALLAMMNERLDGLDKRIFELWEGGHVHAVPPA